jgi:NAD(P)-dependent dehydrogenase (short-subunit alcohol dehydrogenase family)
VRSDHRPDPSTPLSLDGRVVVVSGAARGLGRVEALALGRRHARVVAVDVLDCSDVVREIEDAGGTATGAQIDLGLGEDAARQAVEVALSTYGDLHAVVNNAGVVRDRMSFNLSDEDWEFVLAVNLSATFYLSREAARHWRACHADGDLRRRVLVNTSSESGLYGNVGQANYASAKAGVAALTITLAAELDRYDVRVNAIAPRARTAMSMEAFGSLPLRDDYDPFDPEHVAAVVAWLASDASEDVTGQVLVVHGAAVEVMQPWSIRRRLLRHAGWTDAELLGLKDELFPPSQARRLARPIGELFDGSVEEAEGSLQ